MPNFQWLHTAIDDLPVGLKPELPLTTTATVVSLGCCAWKVLNLAWAVGSACTASRTLLLPTNTVATLDWKDTLPGWSQENLHSSSNDHALSPINDVYCWYHHHHRRRRRPPPPRHPLHPLHPPPPPSPPPPSPCLPPPAPPPPPVVIVMIIVIVTNYHTDAFILKLLLICHYDSDFAYHHSRSLLFLLLWGLHSLDGCNFQTFQEIATRL